MSDAIGRYQGRCVVAFLPDGRTVQLIEDFGYVDPSGVVWSVPAEAIVDGASIPRILWGLIGGPFEDKYRDASVIHDWYCDRRNRPWKTVHRVFFDAMLTSGVALPQAKVLYGAVYAAGPRWSEVAVKNNSLDVSRVRGGSMSRTGRLGGASQRPESWSPPELSEAELKLLAAAIETSNPSLDDIDSLVDSSRG